MNTHPEPNLPIDQTPLPESATKAKRRFLPYGCWPWLLLALLVFVLAGISLPCFGCVSGRGSQTKALAQSKAIGLALKLFASDNEGNYPRQGVPVEMRDAPTNSNLAFACLFPTYTQSESLFGNKLSAYQSARGPDNVIDNPYVWKPVQTLRPGENVYGYIAGLNDSFNPSVPLVVDGTDGTGHYKLAEHVRGGTWKARKAIVIRLDNSGSIENLAGPDDKLYIPRPDDRSQNLLDVGYLGKDVRLLDPAVPGR